MKELRFNNEEVKMTERCQSTNECQSTSAGSRNYKDVELQISSVTNIVYKNREVLEKLSINYWDNIEVEEVLKNIYNENDKILIFDADKDYVYYVLNESTYRISVDGTVEIYYEHHYSSLRALKKLVDEYFWVYDLTDGGEIHIVVGNIEYMTEYMTVEEIRELIVNIILW